MPVSMSGRLFSRPEEIWRTIAMQADPPSPESAHTATQAEDANVFNYSAQLADSVRPDIVEAHQSAWRRIAAAGTWWTGEERVAIAAESRAAAYCQLCRERKAALSPNSVEGEHDHVTGQTRPAAAVDAVHRIVTNATRLTSSWVEGLEQQGMPDTHCVELLSIVVAVRSIDVFHLAMGLDAESLPAPLPGAPRERRPPVSNFARVRRVSYF
jgi:hypothetical protein